MAHLQTSIVIPAPVSVVFPYMTNPERLADQLKGQIEVENMVLPGEVRPGSECQYLMTRFGVSQVVRFEIEELQKNQRFKYRLTEGLMKSWIHTMRFESRANNETLVRDFVEYRLPFGLLGYFADDVFVRADMQRVLEHRLERAREEVLLLTQPGA